MKITHMCLVLWFKRKEFGLCQPSAGCPCTNRLNPLTLSFLIYETGKIKVIVLPIKWVFLARQEGRGGRQDGTQKNWGWRKDQE